MLLPAPNGFAKPRIAYLAAGAAGMYCGSCLRDNRLAATMIEHGRDVVLLPLYTPLRTDEPDVSQAKVLYGGVNVYLAQRFSWFRLLPRFITRVLDAPGVLRGLSSWSGSVDPRQLGALTASVLRGEHGGQQRELRGLIEVLRDLRPSHVHLPNLPFVGVASALKRELGVPVFCTLSGEDIFLNDLPEPYKAECFDLIRRTAANIDGYVAVSEYYGRFAAKHFDLPVDRVHIVPLGVRAEDYAGRPARSGSPWTIGYLARICFAKGLHNLVAAWIDLRRAGRNCRLHVAGYLASGDRPYLRDIEQKVAASGFAADFRNYGEVTREQKIEFLHNCDVLSVPTVYHEAKGLFVLEAVAAGVPVVQPNHGSFPELIRETGGGLLYEPDRPGALASTLARFMDEPALAEQLGEQGRAAVFEKFTDRLMAERTWTLYLSCCHSDPRSAG